MSESIVTVVQGMRGSGKTNYLKGRMASIRPLFVIDIRNEYPHLTTFTSSRDFAKFILNPNGHGSPQQIRFSLGNQKDYLSIFYLLQDVKNATILFDEADALFQYQPFEQPLIDIFLGSRNYNNNLIYATKRPFLLPIVIRSQADEFVIFKTMEKRDILYLSERVAQFPKEPRNLRIGEALVWRTEDVTPSLVKFPEFQTPKG